MLKLKYTLVIEAREDPNFFGFYSPDFEGFSGVGNLKSKITVIRLAARVGGIPLRFASGTNVGANSEHPGEFFGACPELAEGITFGLIFWRIL